MKKIALLTAVSILLMAFSFTSVSAESIPNSNPNNISITVEDFTNDLISVKGNAPFDSMVSVIILNPNKTLAEFIQAVAMAAGGQSPSGVIQYMGNVISTLKADGTGSEFAAYITMNTDGLPFVNPGDGDFTVIVNVDGSDVYTQNFTFYPNNIRSGFIPVMQNYVAANDAGNAVLNDVMEKFSLTSDPLYSDSRISKDDVAATLERNPEIASISTTDELSAVLKEVLILNAFENNKDVVANAADNSFINTEWAMVNDGNGNSKISALYANEFLGTSLNDNGKAAVFNDVVNVDYSNLDYEDIYENFEDSILYHLIKSNSQFGDGHIEELLDTYYAEYTAAGFDISLLTSINDDAQKNDKLAMFLDDDSTDINSLADSFNSIMSTTGDGNEIYLPNVTPPSYSGGGGGSYVPVTPVAPAAHPFKDVESAKWAEDAIKYLYENKIINGRTATEFAPSATVTRAEFVKMITEALKVAEPEKDVAFADVADDAWYASYIKRAASAGIAQGADGQFRPNGEVTRQDAALFVFRALGIEASEGLTFTDADQISDYARSAVAALTKAGIINGMGDGTYAPATTLTRAQAAQLIYGAITKGGAAS